MFSCDCLGVYEYVKAGNRNRLLGNSSGVNPILSEST